MRKGGKKTEADVVEKSSIPSNARQIGMVPFTTDMYIYYPSMKKAFTNFKSWKDLFTLFIYSLNYVTKGGITSQLLDPWIGSGTVPTSYATYPYRYLADVISILDMQPVPFENQLKSFPAISPNSVVCLSDNQRTGLGICFGDNANMTALQPKASRSFDIITRETMLSTTRLIDTKTNNAGQTYYSYVPTEDIFKGTRYDESKAPSSFLRIGMTPRLLVKVDAWGVCFGPNCYWPQLAGELTSTMNTTGTYPFVGYDGFAYMGSLSPTPLLITEDEIPLSYDFVDPANPSPICLPSTVGTLPTILSIISIAHLMYLYDNQNPNITSEDNLDPYPTPPPHPVRPSMRNDPNGYCAIRDYMADLVNIPINLWLPEDVYKAGIYLKNYESKRKEDPNREQANNNNMIVTVINGLNNDGPFEKMVYNSVNSPAPTTPVPTTPAPTTSAPTTSALASTLSRPICPMPPLLTPAPATPAPATIDSSKLNPYAKYLLFLTDFYSQYAMYIDCIKTKLKQEECVWEPIGNIIRPDLEKIRKDLASLNHIGAMARQTHRSNLNKIKKLDDRLQNYIIEYSDKSITSDIVLNYMKYTRMYRPLYNKIMLTRATIKAIENTYYELIYDGPYKINCAGQSSTCIPNGWHSSLLTSTYIYMDSFIKKIESESNCSSFDFSLIGGGSGPDYRYADYWRNILNAPMVNHLLDYAGYAIQLLMLGEALMTAGGMKAISLLEEVETSMAQSLGQLEARAIGSGTTRAQVIIQDIAEEEGIVAAKIAKNMIKSENAAFTAASKAIKSSIFGLELEAEKAGVTILERAELLAEDASINLATAKTAVNEVTSMENSAVWFKNEIGAAKQFQPALEKNLEIARNTLKEASQKLSTASKFKNLLPPDAFSAYEQVAINAQKAETAAVSALEANAKNISTMESNLSSIKSYLSTLDTALLKGELLLAEDAAAEAQAVLGPIQNAKKFTTYVKIFSDIMSFTLGALPVGLAIFDPSMLSDPNYQFVYGLASRANSLFGSATAVNKKMEVVKGSSYISQKAGQNLYTMLGVPFKFSATSGCIPNLFSSSGLMSNFTKIMTLVQGTTMQIKSEFSPSFKSFIPNSLFKFRNKLNGIQYNSSSKPQSPQLTPIIPDEKLVELLEKPDFGKDFYDLTESGEVNASQMQRDLDHFLNKYKISIS